MTHASSFLDHPAVSRRVFYPRFTTAQPNLSVDVGGCQLGCHLRRTFPEAGLVLYFHGNGELAAETERFCGDLFTRAGVNVCFVEYRGYGASDGRPALVAMLGDGESVVRALGVPPERVVAFGRSLGSLYAIELAHRFPQLGGLILESGIASVGANWPLTQEAEEIGCGPDALAGELATHFDHQAKLAAYRGPLLVLHALGDRHLDPTHGDRLHAWGGGANKRFLLFPHGDHNTIQVANLAEYTAAVEEFLRETGLTVALPGLVETCFCLDLLLIRLLLRSGGSVDPPPE